MISLSRFGPLPRPQISLVMDKFESQFSDLDVQTSYMEETMSNTTAVSMPQDEVDAGVGGRAALSIGRRLAQLARTHQVIAVTHLAQVAAFADAHLSVRKAEDASGVVSGVRVLDRSERVTELARMLAGMEDTDTGLAHAEELLERAAAAG